MTQRDGASPLDVRQATRRDQGRGHGHGSHRAERPWELYVSIAAGLTYAAGLTAELAFAAPRAVWLPFYLATYLLGGWFTLQEAWRSVRRGRFEVDFLMLVAAIGAACIGRFGEGAVLLFLFSLGHALEEFALARATTSIRALGDLAPRTAIVRTETGATEERDVSQLRPGDRVLVRPDARVPADGYVVAGHTAVDQSAVTGESIPANKQAIDVRGADGLADLETVPHEARVFAGTLNGAGAIEVIVTALASDSTLARVIDLVQQADATASPTARFIGRFQRSYVPAVIVGVLAVFGFGLAALHEPVTDSLYRAMVVLVAASPCALAIATPAAVLAAVARAARAGVLVKGGAPLEVLGKSDVVAFDKTGTLTWGQPAVTDVVPADGVDPAELLAVAHAAESLSDHPLAGAIVRDLGPRVPAPERTVVTELRSVTGLGVEAMVAGELVRVGSLTWLTQCGHAAPAALVERTEELQRDGRTVVAVAAGDRLLGLIGVMDGPRGESRPTVAALRAAGVSQFLLLSGDNQAVADAVGAAVGVDRCAGGLLPHEKVAVIDDLRGSGRTVCMVGDGVNDAPAMAGASVGIAMGAAGSAVALETADIALMTDDLGRLPFVRRLSQATSTLIRQNLLIALVVVAALVPASLAGLAIGPIVLLHEGSTLLIVANALRLLRFDHGKEHAGIPHLDRPES